MKTLTKYSNPWHRQYKPWITYNSYFDKETGLEVPALEIPGNYIIIKIEKNVRATKTHRIAERTIIVRKIKFKQLSIFE